MANDLQSVLEATTIGEFEKAIICFANKMDFGTVSASTVFDNPDGTAQLVTASNTPPSYLEGFTDPLKGIACPVMQHCKHSNRPLVWTQDTYISAGQGELWEEQAQFGYKNGISMALHMPGGIHFNFGVERDTPFPNDESKVNRLLADIQLFAIYAQETALRVLQPNTLPAKQLVLTTREIEVLRWTLKGKTAWEAGAILGISERTAVFHANNAMHKMGCSTKHLAAIRAHGLGLLTVFK
jgi:DNA-binding CsgD family transcriptional regulator